MRAKISNNMKDSKSYVVRKRRRKGRRRKDKEREMNGRWRKERKGRVEKMKGGENEGRKGQRYMQQIRKAKKVKR